MKIFKYFKYINPESDDEEAYYYEVDVIKNPCIRYDSEVEYPCYRIIYEKKEI